MLLSLILAAIGGFLVGVVVNLVADYAPARRMHFLAKASPFVTQSAIPTLPSLIPKSPDGKPVPIYALSGWGARLAGMNRFSFPRWSRRLSVEVGMALAYLWIVGNYSDLPALPFYLFYAPMLVLISVIDIEYRWILNETLIAVLIAIGLEALLTSRITLEAALKGGLYGFGIMLGLYVLGILFGQFLGIARGRVVSRTILGFGDVKLAAVGGALLGWPYIGFAFLIMIAVAAAGAIILITSKLVRKKRYRMGSAIPYGPYINIGLAAMLYAPWIMGNLLASL